MVALLVVEQEKFALGRHRVWVWHRETLSLLSRKKHTFENIRVLNST
jgi:hypothetical protein